MDDLERILAAAKNHGAVGDPDMEVGDLQQLVRDLWKFLSPEERKVFVQQGGTVIDWQNFLDHWE
jgi:hypothetical protein